MPSTMPYAVLLRGINVGGNNRLPMADLRALLTDLGCTEVATYLQSGNAVVSAPAAGPAALAADLERALDVSAGLSIRVLVRSRDELAGLVAGNPMPAAAADGSRYFVTFLDGPVEPDRLTGVDPQRYAPDRFAVAGREIYLWCPAGLSDSELPKVFSDRRLGVTTTTRNWNTVTRLLAMAGGAANPAPIKEKG